MIKNTKRIFAFVIVLVIVAMSMLTSFAACEHNYVKTQVGGGSTSATISFADKANRTDFDSASKQVWEQNGIKVTNNKAGSTSAVGDYANPGRFYKSSEVIVEYPGMTKLVIDSSGLESKYVAWDKSFSDSNATATVASGVTTITFANPVDSFKFASMSAQCRAYSMTVYAEGGAAVEKLVCESCGDTRDVPTYGDSDGDGDINNRDLAMLMQFVNGWDVAVDSLVVDVNVDGAVNNKDYALLMRYINGWDVEIGL